VWGHTEEERGVEGYVGRSEWKMAFGRTRHREIKLLKLIFKK